MILLEKLASIFQIFLRASHCCRGTALVFALFVSSQLLSAPLISDPKFTQLSTSQGLSQDTVNDILIDSNGFLWVATLTGLDRFDGYRVEQFVGQRGMLSDMGVARLLEDTQGNIWVGSIRSGLFRISVETAEVELISNFAKSERGWSDPVVSIQQLETTQIIVSTQRQVVIVNPELGKPSTLYTLPEELQTASSRINAVLYSNNQLLIGRQDGLFWVDLKSGDEKRLALSSRNRANSVNTLYLSANNQIWIGTDNGLLGISLHNLTAGQLTEHVTDTAILNIFETANNSLYLGTKNGLFSYDPESTQLQHFIRPSESRFYLSSDHVTTIEMDSNGNLWLGTPYDGALYWSTQSVKFENVRQRRGDDIQLSSNSVTSFAQFNQDGLWVGTKNGLNYYDLEERQINKNWMAQHQVGGEHSKIRDLATWQENLLMVNTAKGLLVFDKNNGSISQPYTSDEDSAQILSARLGSFIKGPQDNFYFTNERGFYQYDPSQGAVLFLDALNSQVDSSQSYGFIGRDVSTPDVLWISAQEQLWAFNAVTGVTTLIHQLERNGIGQPVYPESALYDNNETLWIAYPGAGLVGVDATTFAAKYKYNKQDMLPSNVIYGLKQDNSDAIWMSSHSGLLKFDPNQMYLQQYGIDEGLEGKEFNGRAHMTLLDQRIVYGSQKGFTIFDPLTFDAHDGDPPRVAITSIQLSSNPLNMPLTDLDNTEVVLQHFDSGLTIEFSTLSFEHQNSTQYQYRIEGDDNYTYPATTDSQVTFPKLDPGKYTFSAIAFDPITGIQSAPANVIIRVKYAPWLSPTAYAIYIFVFVSLVVFWWYRRDLQNKQVVMAHNEALATKNRLSLALRASNSNVWEWRAASSQFYAPRISEELGYAVTDNLVDFDHHLSLIHEEDRKLFKAHWSRFLKQNAEGLDVTYRLRAQSGEWIWYRDVGNEIIDRLRSDKTIVAGTYSNVTQTVIDREKVRLFGEAFKHTRDWVVIFNTNMQPVAVNAAFCEAFEIDEQGDLPNQLRHLFQLDAEYPPRFWKKLSQLHQTGHWKGEEQLVDVRGKVSNVLINMNAVASMRAQGEVDYLLMIMSDISEQKEAEGELRRLANFDSLTGLPNRTLLLDRIKHGIDHAARYKSKMGVFFIDLDRFKQVNDSLGHKAGDELLQVVAQRLTNLLRQDDTVARLGGDEFVVMVEEVKYPDRLSTLAQQVIDVVEAPIQLGNQTVSVSSSVGIAIYPGDAVTSEELLRNADLAMYHAKEQGRSNFQYFTQHMNDKAQQRLLMENRLKKAHQSKKFINYYQPIVNVTDGLVEGFELLMRWPYGKKMVPPDQFIPVAEELGLIENMTWDALERAMPVLSDWQSKERQVYLSVNLSARHFERQISIDHIVSLLKQYELPVSALRFEITESALMRDYERALEYMANMRAHGFIIALDDFGTGYSSLKYLKEFPIQVLKVDKSFVDDIGKNASNEALVLTTLRMAESLGMYCVAEGIEQAEQIEFFKRNGCFHLQGYFYSKPVPAEQTVELIGKNW